jgi:hypothetical protein
MYPEFHTMGKIPTFRQEQSEQNLLQHKRSTLFEDYSLFERSHYKIAVAVRTEKEWASWHFHTIKSRVIKK